MLQLKFLSQHAHPDRVIGVLCHDCKVEYTIGFKLEETRYGPSIRRHGT